LIANYGYMDGSGEYFIKIDTDKCDGCGECVKACPAGVMLVREDENDPFREVPVATVAEEHRKKIKYSCGPCKPVTGRVELPCVAACKLAALEHSW
jgi:ferredoxin